MSRKQVLAKALWLLREARDLFLALVATVLFAATLVIPERLFVWFGGFMARRIGMRMSRLRGYGMNNLALAFPQMPETERRALLERSWDNMGRTAFEYFYIERLWDFDPASGASGRVEIDGVERFVALATDNKPAIILGAHLANWELPMVAASRHGLEAVALFARPRNRFIARMVQARRQSAMGELVMSGPGALHRLAGALSRGAHVGLLVDQFYQRGPRINLFGHGTEANPVFAHLARQFECPVHMVRVIRLPGRRFRIELTEELVLPRDKQGRIDIAASVQMVGTIIEGWVREHPDQWLWVHRRWR